MKKLILYILGLFILTSATAYAIGAAPLRVEFTAQPGEVVQGEVNVFNDSDTAQTIMISKGDFLVNGDEDVEFMDEVKDGNLYSLQNWIYIPDNEIELDAKSQGTIPYEIRVPEDAPSQGYYGSLFVENKPQTQELFGATVSVRVAHLVLLKVEGSLYEEITIEDFDISEEATEFDVVVTNKGNVHSSPSGEIEVIDSQGNLVQTWKLNSDEHNVLPESKKTYKGECKFKDLEPGIYYVVLESKTDMDIPLEAEMKIEKTVDGKVIIHEKTLGEAHGEQLKEFLQQSRIVRNSIIVVIGILLFAVAFAAIAKYCLTCTKSKKRVVKGKKK